MSIVRAPVTMLVPILAPLLAQAALAQNCAFSMQNGSFGAVDITTGGGFDTFGLFAATCAGEPGATVRICPNIEAGSGGAASDGSYRFLAGSGGRLTFDIARDGARGESWGSYLWGLPGEPPSVEVALDPSGRGAARTNVRFSILPGQTGLPPGAYLSSFAGAGTRINYAYDSAGNCEAISGQNLNPAQAPFTVSAQVSASCTVTVNDANFGERALLDTQSDTANRIGVRCSAGLAYQIGLDGGKAGVGDPAARAMWNGAHRIVYGIFADAARTTGWGDRIGVNTVAGTGTGREQIHTGYFRIPPQPTPPAGVYTDRVVVTVTY